MIWNILTGLTFIIAVFLITFMLWISSQINEKVGPVGPPGKDGKCGRPGPKGSPGPSGGVYQASGYIKLRPHYRHQNITENQCLSKYAIDSNTSPRLEKCNGDTYQYWHITEKGQLKNKGDNKCLSINNSNLNFINCDQDIINNNLI